MTPTNLIQILIAEDHAVVRQGLAAILNDEADMRVVAEAPDGEQAVELYRQFQPDVVLMDLQMPRLEGVAAITQIRAEFATAKLIILTTYDGDEDIYRGLEAGAQGYLLKDTTADILLDGIRRVQRGQKYIPSDIAAKLVDRIHLSSLTRRELEVMQLLTLGNSNATISRTLSISEGTVKFHLSKIMTKLGVGDRTQAVVHALKRGLVRLEP